MSGGAGFFGAGSGFLADGGGVGDAFIDDGDVAAHSAHGAGAVVGGSLDGLDCFEDAAEGGFGFLGVAQAFFNDVVAGFHGDNGVVHVGADFFNQVTNLFGGLTAEFGEFSDFVGDDGEAASHFSGAAASIAALRARRLVWSAMSSMVLTMVTISSPLAPRSRTAWAEAEV